MRDIVDMFLGWRIKKKTKKKRRRIKQVPLVMRAAAASFLKLPHWLPHSYAENKIPPPDAV